MPGENNGESHCNENNNKFRNIRLVITSIEWTCGIMSLLAWFSGDRCKRKAHAKGETGEGRSVGKERKKKNPLVEHHTPRTCLRSTEKTNKNGSSLASLRNAHSLITYAWIRRGPRHDLPKKQTNLQLPKGYECSSLTRLSVALDKLSICSGVAFLLVGDLVLKKV